MIQDLSFIFYFSSDNRSINQCLRQISKYASPELRIAEAIHQSHHSVHSHQDLIQWAAEYVPFLTSSPWLPLVVEVAGGKGRFAN